MDALRSLWLFKTGSMGVIIPVLPIVLLLMAVSLDILSTFIASPGLAHEGNIIIIWLGSTWPALFIYNIACVVLSISLFIVAVNNLKNAAINSTKSIISLILCIQFFSYTAYSLLLVVNNLIAHVWMNTDQSHLVHSTVSFMVNNYKLYHGILYVLALVTGISITLIFLRDLNIYSKYRMMAKNSEQ